MSPIRLAITAAAFSFTLACAPTLADPAQDPADTPDVVINLPAGDAVVTVKVGQTIGVKPPGEGKWQVVFDAGVLTLLTPNDRLEQPGPQGWVWRAAKAGQVDLVLTSKPPPCDSPPCAPNVIRFTIHLNLVAR